jgi:predicted amidohydrolase
MQLKLGMAQIRPALGNVQANLEKHLDFIDRARGENVDLLCFPELSLTGYTLQDVAFEVATRPTPESPVFGPLLDASRDMDLLVGFVDEDQRHRIYIAAAYLSEGKVVHVHHKVYLPTYTYFDEGRHFAWGDEIRAFDTRFGRVGVLICEDFWHASPPYLLWLDGADLFLHHSASPSRGLDTGEQPLSSRWVEGVNQAYASLFTSFVVHTNRVGFEDGINFWGGSMVYSPDGDLIVKGPYFEEALVTTTVDMRDVHRARARLPLLRDERTGLTAKTLARILGSGGLA